MTRSHVLPAVTAPSRKLPPFPPCATGTATKASAGLQNNPTPWPRGIPASWGQGTPGIHTEGNPARARVVPIGGGGPVMCLPTKSGDMNIFWETERKIMKKTIYEHLFPTETWEGRRYLGQTLKINCLSPFHLQDKYFGSDIFFCWILVCSEALVALQSGIVSVILCCLHWMRDSITLILYIWYLILNSFLSPAVLWDGNSDFCLLCHSWPWGTAALPHKSFCLLPKSLPHPFVPPHSRGVRSRWSLRPLPT